MKAEEDETLPLRASDVARRFNVSIGAVRQWADLGLLPSFRTPGGQRRFHRADVDAFIQNTGSKAAS
jgi:excisionase family DNA binding protein